MSFTPREVEKAREIMFFLGSIALCIVAPLIASLFVSCSALVVAETPQFWAAFAALLVFLGDLLTLL